jgi:hypothetical protein
MAPAPSPGKRILRRIAEKLDEEKRYQENYRKGHPEGRREAWRDAVGISFTAVRLPADRPQRQYHVD